MVRGEGGREEGGVGGKEGRREGERGRREGGVIVRWLLYVGEQIMT